MAESVDISPDRFAELVAPAVSRTFIAGIRAAGTDGRELVAGYGGSGAVGYLIDLRNPLAAGRRITRADLAAVYRYRDPAEIDTTVRDSVEGGLLAETPDGSLTPTDRGREFLTDLYALNGRVLTEHWRPHAGTVDRLGATLARVLAAAADTGGPAWAVLAPPYEPAGTPPGVLLLNRLSTLRSHRADAHAAAWQAAGLTAAQMVAMPWGTEWTDQRHAVEQETNQRAAGPYHGLTGEERLALLADLATLP